MEKQSSKIEQAIALMLAAHQGQTLKNGQPYVLHPMHLAEQFENEVLKILCLLHDSVEDSHGKVTLIMIREIFGDVVAEATDALTHRDDEPYEDYIERIVKNALAIEVKIKDLEHNMDVRRMPLPGVPKKLSVYIAAWHRLKAVQAKQERI